MGKRRIRVLGNEGSVLALSEVLGLRPAGREALVRAWTNYKSAAELLRCQMADNGAFFSEASPFAADSLAEARLARKNLKTTLRAIKAAMPLLHDEAAYLKDFETASLHEKKTLLRLAFRELKAEGIMLK